VEHNRGKEKFTKTGIPWLLIYKEAFTELKQARQREIYIKKMKSRKYIETLISSAGQASRFLSGGSLVRIQSGSQMKSLLYRLFLFYANLLLHTL